MLVLIVEDNKDQADSLARVLQLWGFDTETAYDGYSGLTMAMRDRPNVILTDIGLPGLNGFDMAARLAVNPDLQGTVMAAVSAYVDEESLKRSKEVGMTGCFQKPVNLTALHRWLQAQTPN